MKKAQPLNCIRNFDEATKSFFLVNARSIKGEKNVAKTIEIWLESRKGQLKCINPDSGIQQQNLVSSFQNLLVFSYFLAFCISILHSVLFCSVLPYSTNLLKTKNYLSSGVRPKFWHKGFRFRCWVSEWVSEWMPRQFLFWFYRKHSQVLFSPFFPTNVTYLKTIASNWLPGVGFFLLHLHPSWKSSLFSRCLSKIFKRTTRKWYEKYKRAIILTINVTTKWMRHKEFKENSIPDKLLSTDGVVFTVKEKSICKWKTFQDDDGVDDNDVDDFNCELQNSAGFSEFLIASSYFKILSLNAFAGSMLNFLAVLFT